MKLAVTFEMEYPDEWYAPDKTSPEGDNLDTPEGRIRFVNTRLIEVTARDRVINVDIAKPREKIDNDES